MSTHGFLVSYRIEMLSLKKLKMVRQNVERGEWEFDHPDGEDRAGYPERGSTNR